MANKGNSVQGRENSKSKSTKLGTCLACSRKMEVDNIAGEDGLKEREHFKGQLVKRLNKMVAQIRVVAVELRIVWYIWIWRDGRMARQMWKLQKKYVLVNWKWGVLKVSVKCDSKFCVWIIRRWSCHLLGKEYRFGRRRRDVRDSILDIYS